MRIRNMDPEDFDALNALWTTSDGIGTSATDDTPEGLARYLARNPTTSFVAVDDEGAVCGGILCGHDGRRGYIYHTVVAASCQRQGIGGALLKAVEAALAAEGIAKVYVPTDAGYEPAEAFWGGHGFIERNELVFRSKAIGA